MTDQTAAAPTPGKRILYFADPMCSWCYGFGPVIAEIAAFAGERAPVKVVVGGLRPGETEPMSERALAHVRHHWEQVQAETGRPFAFAFFDRAAFVYDTEPACRAVVAVRSLRPDAAIPYFAEVQDAFYREGRDVTREDELADLAAAADIDTEAFRLRFRAPRIVEATRSDFALALALGISGFPCVVLGDDDGYALLTMGYQPFAPLRAPLEQWLAA